MKLKFAKKLLTVFVCATVVSACTAPPRATYDSAKIGAIKTIAVATPTKTNYYAVSAGTNPVMLIGPGLLVSAIAGAVSGAISAASHRTNATFNDLVMEKLGDTGLNRKFIDALETELRSQGYDVKEVELVGDDMPKLVVKDHGYTLALEGQHYTGADAIMVVQNTNGYFAPGSFSWYTRDVRAKVMIYKADTLEPIFNDRLTFNKGNSDPYHYSTYSELKDDLPRAIRGVDEAVMGLVPEFKTDLLASRGVSAATAQPAAAPEKVEQKVAQKPEAIKAE